MNWFAENKIFSSILIVIALGAAALAWLTFSARGSYATVVESYNSDVQTLSGLRALVPFRNAENLKKKMEQVDGYHELAKGVHNELLQKQGPLEVMDPAVFQVRLRDLVSKVIARAAEKNVILPAKFYLGFEAYQNQLPRNEITGLLNWQLTAVDFGINLLIDLKVKSISEPLRAPLPGELSAEPVVKVQPLLEKYPFEIAFSGYPGNAQTVLNEIASSKQAMITRAVKIENSSLESPKKGGEAPSVVGEDGKPAAPASDVIIIGKETVTCSIIIDLVRFNPIQQPKK